jgi:hypothetical protein
LKAIRKNSGLPRKATPEQNDGKTRAYLGNASLWVLSLAEMA